VPHTHGTSLYIRPFMFDNSPELGVKAADRYVFAIILCPVGAYYAAGLKPIKILVEEKYVRAVRGGVGESKTAGNYAASILASDKAAQEGCSQVLWLDGREHRFIEEVGAMNIMFVIDGTLVTPALAGSILPGITRDSVLTLARASGIPVEERPVTVDEVMAAQQNGSLTEVFGTGTAAVVSPVSHMRYHGRDWQIGYGDMGPVARAMYDNLTGLQYGTMADEFGWVETV